MKKGKVWLVGAGPGDPSLLTIKASELIKEADVIVYDRLVGEGILSQIPEKTKMINVGKEGGSHPIPQKEIELILVKEALLGNKVIRLKGGDPFVFGRGGEEIEALIANDIEYEVVPGITSAIAAPSSAGIPVTHRGVANSLHIITAHTKEGKIAETDYSALVKLGGTLVFLMGVTAIPDICTSLIENGMSEKTPIAGIHSGTTAQQYKITGTLKDFPDIAVREKLKAPSVIVVGNVVPLGTKYEWKKLLPLNGKKIAITRPKNRSAKLSKILRDKGAEVLELPTIQTETINIDLPDFAKYDWICFTSITGVESLFENLERLGQDIRSLGNIKIAAIGNSTATQLRKHGLKVDLIPETYDGISMAEELYKKAKEDKILLLRAEAGSDEMTKFLKEKSMNYTEIHIYKTKYTEKSITPSYIDTILFTSASTVKGFIKTYPKLTPQYVCCIGKQTALEAQKAGYKNIKIAKKATLNDLVEIVEEN